MSEGLGDIWHLACYMMGAQWIYVPFLFLSLRPSLASCVTLSKLFNLSDLSFLLCKTEIIIKCIL